MPLASLGLDRFLHSGGPPSITQCAQQRIPKIFRVKWTKSMSGSGVRDCPLTQLLPVSRSRCKLPISLTLNNHPIPPCETVKYLGVTLSSSLSWADHIQSTCKAERHKLGLVHRNFHMAPHHVHHTIYHSAVLHDWTTAQRSGTPTRRVASLIIFE